MNYRYSGSVFGLFKFLEGKYLPDFLRGSLYMNTLQYFAEQEASDPGVEGRGDRWEGIARVFGIRSAGVWINGVYVPIAGTYFNFHGLRVARSAQTSFARAR